MTKWADPKGYKEQMSAFVAPRVRWGMKLAATLEHTTISKLVERLCIEYLRGVEGIGELIDKEG